MSGQHHQQQAGSTTHVVTRKKRRGMIEKRRRDKINSSLSELRRLVPAAFEKQGSAKLEKAEILQMTVDFLRDLHERGLADSLLLTDKLKQEFPSNSVTSLPDDHNQLQLQHQQQQQSHQQHSHNQQQQQQQQQQHQQPQHSSHLELFTNNQQGQHSSLLEASASSGSSITNQPQSLHPHQSVGAHHYSAHHHHHMSTAAAYHHHHAHLSAPDMMARTATGQYPTMSTVTHPHPSLLNLDNHRSHNPLGAYGTHSHAGAASINSYLAATADSQQIQPRLNQHAQPSMAH